ncbi:hypothetical protein KJ627_03180, partial [Patescibacteria group bacterium]|nr:hypothetical protein [Patescibacteria group bacterium]MBU2233831.1 hypothetical protein [Patescibacteria group bacterium]
MTPRPQIEVPPSARKKFWPSPPSLKLWRAGNQAGEKEEIRYEKKSSDFVNNLFNQTTGKRYSVLCFSII